eukprot:1938416-Rhodomonas_salina.2
MGRGIGHVEEETGVSTRDALEDRGLWNVKGGAQDGTVADLSARDVWPQNAYNSPSQFWVQSLETEPQQHKRQTSQFLKSRGFERRITLTCLCAPFLASFFAHPTLASGIALRPGTSRPPCIVLRGSAGTQPGSAMLALSSQKCARNTLSRRSRLILLQVVRMKGFKQGFRVVLLELRLWCRGFGLQDFGFRVSGFGISV